MSILKDIQEGNAANKIAKNLHAVKVGHSKSLHAVLDKGKTHKHGIDGALYHGLVKAQSGSSERYHLKQTADRFKRDGRAVMKTGHITQEEVQPEAEQIDEISVNLAHDYKKKALGHLMNATGHEAKKRVSGIKNAAKREVAHMVKTKGPQSFPDASDGRSLDLPKKKSAMREQIEALLEKEGDPYKKRGRPRKPRHEDGKIVNEDTPSS